MNSLGNGAGGKFANARAELMLCELQLQLLGDAGTILHSSILRRPETSEFTPLTVYFNTHTQ